MKTKLVMIAAAAGLMFIATPMSAHHSFAGTYLEDAQPVTIEGTLVAFLVRNPHSFVHVEDATKKDPKTGEPIRWSIEWGAAGQLAQQGVRTLVRQALLHGARLVHSRAHPEGETMLLGHAVELWVTRRETWSSQS